MTAPERPAAGWRTLLRAVASMLLIGAVGYAAVTQWGQVRPLLGELSWQALAVATAAVSVGICATMLAWRAILADLGFPLPVTAAMRVFFISQLGKYLPGKLWPVLAQMRLGKAHQIPLRASGAAAMVFLLMVACSGLMVAAPALPLLGGSAAAHWWTALLLPVVVVSVFPPALNRLLSVALRVARREPLPRAMSARGTGVAVGWSLLAWCAYGAQIWALARDLGAGNSFWLYAVAAGGFAAAFCVGFLFPVAPAGAGAREVALILLLGVALTRPQATVIAVVSRLLFTVLDAVWAGVSVLFSRHPHGGGREPAVAPTVDVNPETRLPA